METIFFDVGSTLVFPDRKLTLGPLEDHGVRPTPADIKFAERVARTSLDAEICDNGAVHVDHGYWDIYYQALLDRLGLVNDELKLQLIALARRSDTWDTLAEEAPAVLAELKQSYHLGIISNADERLSELLQRLGIKQYFECITASSIVGHEKPDHRIFQSALDCIGTNASQAIYVGDIYAVDYLGATAVGMRAVLMDVYDVYAELAIPRVRSMVELGKFLLTLP